MSAYVSDFVSNKTWIVMTSPSSLQIAPFDMLLVSAVNLLFYFVTHIQDISFPVDLVSFASAHNNSGYYWLLLRPFRVRRIRFNWRVQYDSITRVHGPCSRAPVHTNRGHGPCVPSFKKKAPWWCKRSNWGRRVYDVTCVACFIMAALRSRCGHYIFVLFLFSCFFLA